MTTHQKIERNTPVYYRTGTRFFPAVFIASYPELPKENPVRIKAGENEMILRRNEIYTEGDKVAYENQLKAEKLEKEKAAYAASNYKLIEAIDRFEGELSIPKLAEQMDVDARGLGSKVAKLKRLKLIP